VAGAVQAPVRAFNRAIAWPIRGLNGLADAVLHRFGLEAKEELSSARSAEELLAVVRRSAQQGSLEIGTARLLARSLLFGQRRAIDAMTPRVRIESIAATDSVARLVDRVAESGYSRLPVTGTGIDDIVGLAHIRSALGVPRDERDHTPVSQVMLEPVLVPATLGLDEVLDALQQQGRQLAVVIDEYGGTDGLVTLEDLAEELVGEVDDEFDARRAEGVRPDGDGWLVPAGLSPGDAGFALGRAVPTGSWSTVAGLFLEHFHRIPEVGDRVSVDGLTWTVRRLDGRRIVMLYIEAIDE
jgi:CBS domain containing-hemolysin-like protein